jgi:hypothetical protein
MNFYGYFPTWVCVWQHRYLKGYRTLAFCHHCVYVFYFIFKTAIISHKALNGWSYNGIICLLYRKNWIFVTKVKFMSQGVKITYNNKSSFGPLYSSLFGPQTFIRYGDLYSLSSVVLVPRETLQQDKSVLQSHTVPYPLLFLGWNTCSLSAQ